MKIPEGVWAFVPSPLPPTLEFDAQIVSLAAETGRLLGELNGAGRRLPEPSLLIGPLLRREAVLSSRIEGTVTSVDQLVLFETDQGRHEATADTKEVANFVRAIESSLGRLKELPLSLRLLREAHQLLLDGARGADNRPGDFRDRQNYIRGVVSGIENARFVPPPVTEMTTALHDLERFVNEPGTVPPLVDIALVHYQFEAIHPFADGNGRIGRLLVTLMLCQRSILSAPLLNLSGYLEKNRQTYLDLLLAVSQRGSWKAWVSFFLCALHESAKETLDKANSLLNLRDQYRQKAQEVGRSALLVRLVDRLFMLPAISSPLAGAQFDLSPRGAKLAIEKLVKAGILVEATGRQRNRVYIAPGILRILR